MIASEKFAEMIQDIEPKIGVTIVPCLDHMAMLYAPSSIAATLATLEA